MRYVEFKTAIQQHLQRRRQGADLRKLRSLALPHDDSAVVRNGRRGQVESRFEIRSGAGRALVRKSAKRPRLGMDLSAIIGILPGPRHGANRLLISSTSRAVGQTVIRTNAIGLNGVRHFSGSLRVSDFFGYGQTRVTFVRRTSAVVGLWARRAELRAAWPVNFGRPGTLVRHGGTTMERFRNCEMVTRAVVISTRWQ